MKDIFDSKIFCENCDKEMKNNLISKNGFNLRIKECKNCGEQIIHPTDRQEYEEFIKLKKKDFEVKMRMVGNSYAVSIPREIVDFMKEQERMINDMVRLSFEDAGRLSLMFNTQENSEDAHVVSAKEVKIVRNGKPVLHARKFTDNKNPSRNKTHVFRDDKALKDNEEIEEEIEEDDRELTQEEFKILWDLEEGAMFPEDLISIYGSELSEDKIKNILSKLEKLKILTLTKNYDSFHKKENWFIKLNNKEAKSYTDNPAYSGWIPEI